MSSTPKRPSGKITRGNSGIALAMASLVMAEGAPVAIVGWSAGRFARTGLTIECELVPSFWDCVVGEGKTAVGGHCGFVD